MGKTTANSKNTYTIGFDLGGTKLAAALVRGDGHIVDFVKWPLNLKQQMTPKKAQNYVISHMGDIAADFQKRYPQFFTATRFRGVGLASAGPLNVETGTLIHPANFRGWKIVPIRQMLEQELRRRGLRAKVFFQNDAMAAALAEGWVGAARGQHTYAVVTVGTGIGSGVIINGRPCQSGGAGSEFGHTLLDMRGLQMKPQQRGHFTAEGLASGTALIRRAREMGFTGTSVEELVLENKSKYNVLFDDMAWALGVLSYNLSIGFRPQAIYLSGGLIKIKDLYLEKTKKHHQNLVNDFNPLFRCPIRIAKTKNQAGVMGAAYLPYLG